jgi:hypothetical protein
MARKTVHFTNTAGYRRWLAYGHIHGVFDGPGETVYIHGKKHRVMHKK